MADYLLEIGTEELPAGYIPEAQKNLEELLGEALRQALLSFSGMRVFSTPRRLAVIVSGLASHQKTTHKRVKGPPVKDNFDQTGVPSKQALGFASKHKLKVEELERESIGGVEYLIANVTTLGRIASEVLSEIVPKLITQLSGERPMRWATYDMKFTRPVRWIVSLLDNEVVPVKLEGVPCGRNSVGHRVLHHGPIRIKSPQSYQEELKAAYVLVDPLERKQLIEKQVAEIARSKSGTPKQLKGSLLEEVVNITEWPHAVAGQFEEEYLKLPDTLIETVMVHHQRYFPIERKDADRSQRVNKNNLLPWFITVANNDRKAAEPMIKQGNERVLRARLADGRFFYFDDQKTKLSDRREALNQLTFQEGLGSYGDKVDRLTKLSLTFTAQLNLDARISMCLERTALLGKLDLVTNLVRELPELQGYVGSWYAEQEGEPPDVVTAIASHYAPRSSDDCIPGDTIGMLASIADKLDNLACLFSLGKKPSGSGDPYALRRQAQGLLDIACDGLKEYPLDITAAIEQLLGWLEPSLKNRKQGFNQGKVRSELQEFLMQRLRGKLLDKGAGREIVDAALSAKDPLTNLPDVLVRITAVENLLGTRGGVDLVRIADRIGRILKPDSPEHVDPSLFISDAENSLWETFNEKVVKQWQNGGQFRQPADLSEYTELLELLRPLVEPVDKYFDQVMVNDQDQAKRDNRHGQLRQIDRYFRTLADFPKLQSLLA